MIEILGEFYDGSDWERISALEELYFSAALGATFRSFEGHIRWARVRLSQQCVDGYSCEIQVATSAGEIHAGGGGTSRASAFNRASEQLDRRLFSQLSGDSSADIGAAALGRMAA